MENEKGDIVDLYVFQVSSTPQTILQPDAGQELRSASCIITKRKKPNSTRIQGNFTLTLVSLNSYVPRKCSATNRIIKAKDHASVQLSVGKVDENGRYTGENQVYALCGFVRSRAESDDSLNRLAQKDGFLKAVWSASGNR